MCFGDTIKIGDQVPNMPFKVFHENDEKEMSISDFKGKWLILFLSGRFYICMPDRARRDGGQLREV